LTRAGPRHRAR